MRLLEKLLAQRQQPGPAAVGQKAEEADADKAARQDVQQKPPKKLVRRQGHLALLVAVSVIPASESDLTVFKADEAMVGDGHAMRITSKILKHVIWSAERCFSIHHPVLSKQWPQEGVEGSAFCQTPESAGADEFGQPGTIAFSP